MIDIKATILNFIKAISMAIYNFFYNIFWWIGHQFAVTSLKNIRSAGKKPPTSIGWEIWQEFNQRYKLEFWTNGTYTTIEVKSWSYSRKYKRLKYIENITGKLVTVCAAQEMQVISTTMLYWEPVVDHITVSIVPKIGLSDKFELRHFF